MYRKRTVRVSELSNDKIKEIIEQTQKRIERLKKVEKVKLMDILGNKNFFEKYSQLGEVIYSNQIALKELTLQQKLTNEMLATIFTGSQADNGGVPVKLAQGNIYYYTTKVEIQDTHTITNRETILDIDGKGRINQILCKGQTNNYGIFILLDGNLTFDKPYSYFSELSDHLENASAFEDDGKYVLSIRNLEFQESARIDITSESSTIFDDILVKYTARDILQRG